MRHADLDGLAIVPELERERDAAGLTARLIVRLEVERHFPNEAVPVDPDVERNIGDVVLPGEPTEQRRRVRIARGRGLASATGSSTTR